MADSPPPLPPGAVDTELQQRLDRMAQAAKASAARRGRATMLQKALDPGMKGGKDNDWETCSESSCESLSSLRYLNSPKGRQSPERLGPMGTLSPTARSGPGSPSAREQILSPRSDITESEGAKELMHRLTEMGIAPVVEGPAPLQNMSFCSNMSFSAVAFPPPLPVDGLTLESIIYKAPPQRAMVECFIVRDNTDKRYPSFTMFLEHKRRFLLAARKRKMNTTSNYVISTSRDDLHRHSDNFVGKLRANFLGTEFVIYDNGERQAKDTTKQRKTLGCVIYERNVLGTNGPRKMHVAVPVVNEADGEMVEWTPSKDDHPHSTFLEHFQSGNRVGLVAMHSAEPEWVPEKNTFVLDFNGRVKKSSVKNFQLKEDNRPPILMQFGKVDKDHFIVDFQHPFNALQAFAIALSSFDSKLACE